MGFLVVVGVVLYLSDYRLKSRHRENVNTPQRLEKEEDNQGECCGMHLVCEKDSLSSVSGEVEYYDDEELDRFVGRSGDDYTAEETEEFRDVLMTLRPEDVAGWARSITVRGLALPPDVRDELLLLVNERRGRSLQM